MTSFQVAVTRRRQSVLVFLGVFKRVSRRYDDNPEETSCSEVEMVAIGSQDPKRQSQRGYYNLHSREASDPSILDHIQRLPRPVQACRSTHQRMTTTMTQQPSSSSGSRPSMAHYAQMPQDARLISLIIASMGIEDIEPGVEMMLLEWANRKYRVDSSDKIRSLL